ncbi:FtsX-like permease family protein [uncultured Acetatifactor sp.]|uniref:FtsX-like permease family protein n=1 Tax=uncultured Acetatifactor sp. TaxID=1671927 RepID=UPI0026342601|nr:ABC transporter permease [uncultured Acetatifactor sp.]
MYLNLAVRNVKRQVGNYLIYFMTVSLTVALLFAINNVIYSRELAVFVDRGESARTALKILVAAISFVVAFVLSYATSFLLKRRKREFGTYLTLGMDRRDILSLFLAETFVICGIALGAGLTAGGFLFQGLMAVMMKLLEMDFSMSAYSLEGLLRTVALTVGIFLVASLASGIYLKRVSIYDLIHGDRKVERRVKRPGLWFVVTAAALGGMAACGILFWRSVDISLRGGTVDSMEYLLAGFILCVMLFHMGAAKSIVFLLLRSPRVCGRGANTFVLRQLSGSLSVNSVMFGCLALLMSLAVVGTNFSFIQKAAQEEALYVEWPYDIMYYSNKYHREGAVPLEEAERSIAEYAGIRRKVLWRIFETGEQEFYGRTWWYEERMAPNDSFMTASDFNALMAPLGVEPVALEGQFMIVGSDAKAAEPDWSGMVWEHGGKRYTFHSCRTDYPKISYLYFYIVVPDEAVADMECVEESRAYLTEKQRFDGIALYRELARLLSAEADEDWGGDGEEPQRLEFEIREYHRQEENNVSAILVVGALFASAVFLLLAMAILALKTLSGLGEDKGRYEILFRLGMGQREQARALFGQTFFFFIAPFALPMALSVPMAAFGAHVMRMEGMEASAEAVWLIAGIVAGVTALLYLLYYTASYLIARRTVVRD